MEDGLSNLLPMQVALSIYSCRHLATNGHSQRTRCISATSSFVRANPIVSESIYESVRKLIFDVIICPVEYELNGIDGGAAVVAAANHPNIHLYEASDNPTYPDEHLPTTVVYAFPGPQRNGRFALQ
jgi:hypothetical protein